MSEALSQNSSRGSRLTISPLRSAHQSSASRESPVASRMTAQASSCAPTPGIPHEKDARRSQLRAESGAPDRPGRGRTRSLRWRPLAPVDPASADIAPPRLCARSSMRSSRRGSTRSRWGTAAVGETIPRHRALRERIEALRARIAERSRSGGPARRYPDRILNHMMSRADRSAAGPVPRWLSPSRRDHPRNRSSVMTRHRPARGGATRELLRGPGSARRRAFGSTLWLRADVLQPAGEVTANAGGASLGALAARHRQRKTDDLSRAPPAAGARPPRHHERAEAGYPDRPQQSFAEECQERAGHQQSDPTVTSGRRAPPRGACCSSTVARPRRSARAGSDR